MSSRTASVLAPPAYGSAVRAWYDAAEALLQPWRRMLTPEPGCGCEQEQRCGCDPCRCCEPDADIVVHMRSGERRVVPLLLRNPGRRPLVASIDVGPFRPCGSTADQLHVESRLLPEGELQLGPCEERIVRLVLDIALPDGSRVHTGPTAHDVHLVDAGNRPLTPEITDRRLVRHEEQCSTLVADVRFTGCGSRAIRIGLVVLPVACEAYEVRCDCGCC